MAERCVSLAQNHLTQAHLFDLFDEWSDFVFVQKKGRIRACRCGTSQCHLGSSAPLSQINTALVIWACQRLGSANASDR